MTKECRSTNEQRGAGIREGVGAADAWLRDCGEVEPRVGWIVLRLGKRAFDGWAERETVADLCRRCETELLAESRFCHQCGKRVAGAAWGATRRGRWVQGTRWLLWIGWAVCALAWVLIAAVDVESVVGTGPALFLIGLATVVAGARARYPAAWGLGLAHCAICIVFVALINLLSWNPSQAAGPFTVMGLAYTVVTLPICIIVFGRPPQVHEPWECAQCGYMLFGLREPRCPECGLAFDPARFEAIAAREREVMLGDAS